jgi:HTH-type transcriptional regulator/antitoxin HipB
MTRRAYIADGIGERIRTLRQERGWTQTDLAGRVGTTKRAIIHYETHGKFPPAPILAAMAGAFGLTMETLMGPEEPERRLKRDEPDLLNDPEDRRLWKRLQQIKGLPERDQRAVLRMLDAIAGNKTSVS